MPTYSYACKTCGYTFDKYQDFSEAALTTCPECQGQLRKMYKSVGVVFKGSGFYRTDSRSGKDAAIPSAKAGSGAASSSSSSDTKASSSAGSSEKTASSSAKEHASATA